MKPSPDANHKLDVIALLDDKNFNGAEEYIDSLEETHRVAELRQVLKNAVEDEQ